MGEDERLRTQRDHLPASKSWRLYISPRQLVRALQKHRIEVRKLSVRGPARPGFAGIIAPR